jgi:hypothetical protein
MNRSIAGILGFLSLSVGIHAQSPAAAEPAWNLMHPNATALIGANVRSIRESTVGQSLRDAIQKSSLGMLNFPGLELLNDIDTVLISSPGQKPLSAKGNPPFLIIVTGNFPPEHVRTLLRDQHRTYHGVEIYPPKGEGNSSMALIDEHTFLVADLASLEGAIDRREAAAKPSGLLARAASMAAVNDAWVVVTMPPSAFQPAGLSLGKVVSSIRGLEAGIAFHDGFNLEVNLAMKDAEAAQEMARQLSVQLLSAISGKLDEQQAAELARKLQIGAQGTRMNIKFAMTREELDQKLKAMQSRSAENPATGPILSIRPEPKQPGTIRIYGLDEGLREIPLSPKKPN